MVRAQRRVRAPTVGIDATGLRDWSHPIQHLKSFKNTISDGAKHTPVNTGPGTLLA